jgi:hypothetical protein
MNPAFASLPKSIVILAACLTVQIIANAQILPPEPSTIDDPDPLMTVLTGWDFSEMTLPEETAFMGMVNPLTEKEIAQILTPAQWQEREQWKRNFNDPKAFSQWLAAHPLTPAQSAQQQLSIWMMSHLPEYGQLQNQTRTQAQIQELAAAVAAILRPPMQPLTPAQQSAINSLRNPTPKPKPVTITVPLSEAATILSPTNPPAIINPARP